MPVWVSQPAYTEGLNYARERRQFETNIIDFPAVYDMLSRMKAKLDAGRSILYQTARYVDIYKALDDIARERKLTPEERAEQKKYMRLADAFTPLAKGMNSEYANQNAYDAIQIHGGSGFIMEYKSQRLYRDARIFSIYEGTTQLQVVAAIRYITNGTYLGIMKGMLEEEVADNLKPLKERGGTLRREREQRERVWQPRQARLPCTSPLRDDCRAFHVAAHHCRRLKSSRTLRQECQRVRSHDRRSSYRKPCLHRQL